MLAQPNQTEIALLACRLLVAAWESAASRRLAIGRADVEAAYAAARAALGLQLDRAADAYDEEIDR